MPITTHPNAPQVAVPCGCALGEEVTWDARNGSLTWVDIEKPAIWRHWPETGEVRHLPVDETISFALLTPDPDVLVAGFKSGVGLFTLSDGRRVPLVRPDPHPAGNRLNSGQVGPDGALYFSTMDDAETRLTGTFHRWDGRSLTAFGGQAAVTNGPVIAPDGRCAYTADTAGGIVRTHAFGDDGIGEARDFVVFAEDWGKPDGLTVDAEGHLWVCHYGGARVTRFSPDGRIERVLPMPTDLVTKCTFGGADLTTLYITTALRGRDPALEPLAGHLFAVETGLRGTPSHIFGRRGDLIGVTKPM